MLDVRSFTPRRFPIQTVTAVLCVVLILFGNAALRVFALGWLLAGFSIAFIVFIHEFGHLIAGLSMGYRLSEFAVGKAQIYRDDNRFRFRWYRSRLEPSNYWGFTSFFIKDYTDFRRRRFWSVLGGPLASVPLMIIAGVFYTNFLASPPAEAISLVEWLSRTLSLQLFWGSVVLLVLSLYPAWTTNDGGKLLRLLRGGDSIERMLRHVQIGQAITEGVRPRDWNITWIDALTALNGEDAEAFTSNELLYYWALDRGEVQEAEKFMVAAIKLRHKVSRNRRADIRAEAIYFEMRYHATVQTVEQLIDNLGKEQLYAQPITRLRLNCAANLIRRDYPETREIAHYALQLLDQEKAKDGFSIMGRDQFKEMLDHAPI